MLKQKTRKDEPRYVRPPKEYGVSMVYVRGILHLSMSNLPLETKTMGVTLCHQKVLMERILGGRGVPCGECAAALKA